MDVVVGTVAGLLVVYLVIVVPLVGRARYARFRRAVVDDPSARLRYYRSSLPWKYGVAALAVALYFANGSETYGLRLAGFDGGDVTGLLWVALGVAVGAVVVRLRLARPSWRAGLFRGIRGFVDLLPRTPTERRMWVLVSVSAGITEEILYRAFLLIFLAGVLPDASVWTIVVISSAAFGFAHLYQGPKGVILTGLLGAVLATIVISAGLIGAIALHTLIDLRILVIPPDAVTEATADPDRETHPE